MGYGNGIADPMEIVDGCIIGAAKGEARVANARAEEAEQTCWEWKRHADQIKQELRESMRSQWNLAHQRDGWQKVAVHFWKKYAPDVPRDDFLKFYEKMKEEVIKEKPIPQTLK